jgi:hypothetical protein
MLSKSGWEINGLLVYQSMAETSVYIAEIRGRTRGRMIDSLQGASKQQANSKQTASKQQANSKQTEIKQPANSKQTASK